MLYNLLPIFLGVIILFLGIFMTVFPRISTRKDRRDDPSAVAKNRVSGIVMTILGVAVIVIRILFLS